MKPNEFLCVQCLETRIGRPLTFADQAGGGVINVSRKQWCRWLRLARKGNVLNPDQQSFAFQ
jgi:hypothetical protein